MNAEQQTIASLKIRVFDLSEQLVATQQQAKEFSDALTKIVQILGVTPVDNEDSIALSSIVEAVEALVPSQEVEVVEE